MGTFDNYLEDEYRPGYEAWQGNQTPEGNAAFLKELDPIVQKGVKMYGNDSPLAQSKAKLIALDALKKYDPKRSRLQSHMLTQMQSLRRAQRKQEEILRAPERILLENQKLQAYTQEIQDELGREPTDSEISNRLGVSLDRLKKIRQFQPGLSLGQAESADPMQGAPASSLPGQTDTDYWVELVYHDLNPIDQKILEMTLGLHGQKKLSNQEIAKKLNRTPGAVSQRKVQIQKILDQEQDLSPFI